MERLRISLELAFIHCGRFWQKYCFMEKRMCVYEGHFHRKDISVWVGFFVWERLVKIDRVQYVAK